MVLRYWFIYIFDIKDYKDYFLNTKIEFDNNFYFSKFIYLFLIQNLNNFAGFTTRFLERWLNHMKRPVAGPVAGPGLLVHSRILFMIDPATAQMEVVMKSLGG